MVRSGEQSGRLEDALDRVAYQVEKSDALRRQVKSALMYPALIFGFAIVVLVAVVAFVIPVFVGIFNQIAEENPGESSALAAADPDLRHRLRRADRLLVHPDPGPGRVRLSSSSGGRRPTAAKSCGTASPCGIPFKIGDVIQKVALARWSRTFSGAVSAGVPMLQAIKLTGETAGNVVIEQAMDEVYSSVKRGGSLGGPIEADPIFPPMVSHMVAVGEETGQLEHMLSKIADFYETEVDAKVKALTSLIEPLMIVFVGGMVGFIVIAMYLPIFSLYDKIR